MTRVNISYNRFPAGEIGEDLQSAVDLELWRRGLKLAENMLIRTTGGAYATPGTRFVLAQRDEGRPARLIPFVKSRTDAFVLEFSEGKARIFAPGGFFVESAPGVPYEFSHPFTQNELADLQYVQAGDDIHIVTGQRHRIIVQRFGALDWRVTEARGQNGPFERVNTDETKTVTISQSEGTATLTAQGFTFDPALQGSLFRIRQKAEDLEPQWEGGSENNNPIVVGAGVRRRVEEHVYEAVNTAEVGKNPPVHLSGERSAGNDKVIWRYLHSGVGHVEITSILAGGTQANVTIKDYVPDSVQTRPTPNWAEGAFGQKNGFPNCIGFFQSRLMLGKDTAFYGSRPDDFENFQPGTDDDLALNFPIVQRNNQLDRVVWLQPLSSLVAGTGAFSAAIQPLMVPSGDGVAISSSRLGEPITPTNVSVREIATVGLAVSVCRQELSELAFDAGFDQAVARNMTLRASHIAGEGFTRLAWQQRPGRLVWAARADGVLAAMTFERNEDVAAWTRHTLSGGAVEDICVIPTENGGGDELWMTVRRVIDGRTRRYVEVMTQPQSFFEQAAPVQAWFVNSGLRLAASEPVETVLGLEHLEGATVQVLADGALQGPFTVQDGAIRLEYPASTVLVGLPYVKRLRPLNPDFALGEGDTVGDARRVRDVTIRGRAVQGYVQSGRSAPQPLRKLDERVYGQAPHVAFGLFSKKLSGGWRPEADLEVGTDLPFPFEVSVISAALELAAGG